MAGSRDLVTFCQALPKVELHAHLHGCVRRETLAEWAGRSVSDVQGLDGAFAVFPLIHATVSDLARLRRVVIEAIEDFHADNVVYLELRSTPRALGTHSKADYIQCVVAAMSECMQRPDLSGIAVRFLISIDRSKCIDDARDAIKFLESFKHPLIVGVDLSGNPCSPKHDDVRFQRLLDVLQTRPAEYPLTVHFGEYWNVDELHRILAINPDRLGHAFHVDPRTMATEQACRCCHSGGTCSHPICSLCNVLVFTEPNGKPAPCLCPYHDHPLKHLLLDADAPVCICTDDPTVFRSTSTLEYIRAARAFQLSHGQIINLVRRSLPMMFDQTARDAVENLLDSYAARHV
ncbi:unnamed protein product (mitochondrion) [Plasmodiophora brassicae]|uniref:Adenosine deaminase domain-containing protein n=1 Tax=Plasmodiophora brassicae TaxID=37360 RepID=A0A3P3YGD9_PLABS|nr:unnamed protein product [Plasmodiophora brassicae]